MPRRNYTEINRTEADMIIKRDRLFTPAGSNRRLHIYLPDNYYQTDERYPVMYFFDGHNLFFNEDATFGKSWGLKEYLDSWHKKMIIVGIECSHEGNQRLQEYCPYVYTGKFWGVLHGTGKETLVWMTEELKPDIDREFRTYAFREATGIAGSSMGGLMALYGVVMHNHVFSKAACVSSSIGPGMKELMQDISDAPISPDTRVYLSWGEEEAKYFGNKDLPALTTKTAQNNYTIAGLQFHDVPLGYVRKESPGDAVYRCIPGAFTVVLFTAGLCFPVSLCLRW